MEAEAEGAALRVQDRGAGGGGGGGGQQAGLQPHSLDFPKPMYVMHCTLHTSKYSLPKFIQHARFTEQYTQTLYAVPFDQTLRA